MKRYCSSFETKCLSNGARLAFVGMLSLLCTLGFVNTSMSRPIHKAEHVALASFALIDAKEGKTLDELMHERLDRLKSIQGSNLAPELLRMEANYVRTSGSIGEDVLFEASFHLEPRYMSISPEGRDESTTANRNTFVQPIMYFIGSARTPLALPMVSNLSKSLRSDAASYTVNIGILPLPSPANFPKDSIRYYVIIERTLQSNTSESEVKIERFDKEFTQKADEPVRLKLENAPPEKNARIVQLDDGSTLDFYDDFARFFTEHIFLSSDRLQYSVGKAEISPISQQLTIPYSIAIASKVKIELLSVLDGDHPLTMIDTIKRPASYLAEWSLKQFANGPYRCRVTARDIATDRVLFIDTIAFTKSAPVVVESPTRLGEDTLILGGKKEDAKALFNRMNIALNEERVKTERLDATLTRVNSEKKTLEDIVNANKRSSIAGLRMRSGLGFGPSSGTNLFVGIESASPNLALDLSFGVSYWSTPPFLVYTQPQNVSRILSGPKSLGLQLSYVFAKPFGGLIEPMAGLGYFGTWSNTTEQNVIKSATIIVPSVGIASEPGGENSSFGLSLNIGEAIGLGVGQSALLDVSGKFYVRF
jgi:hypothetical protein